MLRATIAVAALTVASTSAFAANPEFCAAYATAAVKQVQIALTVPACARGATGSRWSPDYRVHFDWCLSQPAPGVEEERVMRTGYLRGCRGF